MPIIVIGLIIINIIVFILPTLVKFSGVYPTSDLNFKSLGWKDNASIADGEYYRLITAGFLHGDITHLLLNMYSLWVVGMPIFNIFGALNFAIIYIVSLFGSSMASFWFNPSPSVGASGAILGLLGALTSYSILTGNTASLSQIGLNLLILVIYGFMSSIIDNWGHLGGYITGLAIGFVLLYTKAFM
jgi:rhomboid protease GluP